MRSASNLFVHSFFQHLREKKIKPPTPCWNRRNIHSTSPISFPSTGGAAVSNRTLSACLHRSDAHRRTSSETKQRLSYYICNVKHFYLVTVAKSQLRIKAFFYGTSENTVKTRIWMAISVYVLVAIVKKRLDTVENPAARCSSPNLLRGILRFLQIRMDPRGHARNNSPGKLHFFTSSSSKMTIWDFLRNQQ